MLDASSECSVPAAERRRCRAVKNRRGPGVGVVDTGHGAHDGPGAGPAGPLAARKVPIMGAMQGGRLRAAQPDVTAASLEPGGCGTTLIY
eukprot:scaffold48136_cov51-Phaeocystis_antarctica.AAC.2